MKTSAKLFLISSPMYCNHNMGVIWLHDNGKDTSAVAQGHSINLVPGIRSNILFLTIVFGYAIVADAVEREYEGQNCSFRRCVNPEKILYLTTFFYRNTCWSYINFASQDFQWALLVWFCAVHNRDICKFYKHFAGSFFVCFYLHVCFFFLFNCGFWKLLFKPSLK